MTLILIYFWKQIIMNLVVGIIVFDLVSNNNACFFLMTFSSSSSDNDVNVWHSRLRHIGQQRMNRLAKKIF